MQFATALRPVPGILSVARPTVRPPPAYTWPSAASPATRASTGRCSSRRTPTLHQSGRTSSRASGSSNARHPVRRALRRRQHPAHRGVWFKPRPHERLLLSPREAERTIRSETPLRTYQDSYTLSEGYDMIGRVPYVKLSELARHEAHRKSLNRPPYYLHKWWARRTGSVVRGILLDLLLPEEEDIIGAFYRSHKFSDVTILDPFMGGGTILGEALRLGCNVVGSDLNPVAWFLVKRSLSQIAIKEANAAFADVEAKVAAAIAEMYAATCSSCAGQATVQHAAWIKQIGCRACGEPVDLNLDRVVMRAFGRGGASLADSPDCGAILRTDDLDIRVDCPDCARTFVPRQQRCRNTNYSCRCGHQESILGKRRRLPQPLPHRLRSLTIWCKTCGRVHQAPTEADREHFTVIEKDVQRRFRSLLIPRGRIPTGHNTDPLRRYGYRYWRDLFNARQLASLDLLFRAVKQVKDRPSREL